MLEDQLPMAGNWNGNDRTYSGLTFMWFTYVHTYVHAYSRMYTHVIIAMQLHVQMHGGICITCVHLQRIGVANGYRSNIEYMV